MSARISSSKLMLLNVFNIFSILMKLGPKKFEKAFVIWSAPSAIKILGW